MVISSRRRGHDHADGRRIAPDETNSFPRGCGLLDRTDDTIVAISSAAGRGLLGIVRLSGPRAIEIADSVAVPHAGPRLVDRPGSIRIPGAFQWDEGITLPAVFFLFRGPHSYTRQDLVEIQTIGGPVVLEAVRRRLLERGARPAEAGEFTARAFLLGGMNLARAEAVAAVIRAQSDTQLRAARHMSEGILAQRISAVGDELSELLALVEADIDFAEEPIDFITPSVLHDRLSRLKQQLCDLLESAETVERFDALPQILLFGAPNVGKSSLMNRLCGAQRAICAAAAGTTRDILSAPIRLPRSEAILLDTAGVDCAEDEIIAAARVKTVSASERVDLVCVVIDLTRPDGAESFGAIRALAGSRIVVAANKRDLLTDPAMERALASMRTRAPGRVVAVSALHGTGIDELRTAISDALAPTGVATMTEATLMSERQRTAVREALASIDRAALQAAAVERTIDRAELLAFELRDALSALGAITGEVTTEDLLSRVFAQFCIGK